MPNFNYEVDIIKTQSFADLLSYIEDSVLKGNSNFNLLAC